VANETFQIRAGFALDLDDIYSDQVTQINSDSNNLRTFEIREGVIKPCFWKNRGICRTFFCSSTGCRSEYNCSVSCDPCANISTQFGDGNSTNGNDTCRYCSKGYEGRLCSRCEINYFRGPAACHRCPESATTPGLIVLGVFLGVNLVALFLPFRISFLLLSGLIGVLIMVVLIPSASHHVPGFLISYIISVTLSMVTTAW
jgi:hypothetical protein